MIRSFLDELWQSSDAIFQNHLSWFLITGPIAILGQNVFSEATCFALAGLALIPCAERLSFITEQVALHTNASIGALLNATFGNAPELLIATAAIRSGFYRLTQLTMLGSMITNMVFVFGLSCFVGGLRWQTQELHVGTAVIAMLLLSTAGSLIPAALVLSGHFVDTDRTLSTSTMMNNPEHHHHGGGGRGLMDTSTGGLPMMAPSSEEITLSRVNAAVMLTAYILYLIFQLGTHVNEAPERHSQEPRPNVACRRLFKWAWMPILRGITRKRSSNLHHLENGLSVAMAVTTMSSAADRSMDKSSSRRQPDDVVTSSHNHHSVSDNDDDNSCDGDDDEEAVVLLKQQPMPLSQRLRDDSERSNHTMGGNSTSGHTGVVDPLRIRENCNVKIGGSENTADPFRIRETPLDVPHRSALTLRKSHDSDYDAFQPNHHNHNDQHGNTAEPRFSMRVGIFWLFVVTMCISAMSDILVNTIDGFAQRMRLSQVFTSMVIIPFFSNIAEQVSSVIFGYRNEYV
jgi:Ca2+/H+ antiporter